MEVTYSPDDSPPFASQVGLTMERPQAAAAALFQDGVWDGVHNHGGGKRTEGAVIQKVIL